MTREDYDSWVRCLDAELAAGDIDHQTYWRERARYAKAEGVSLGGHPTPEPPQATLITFGTRCQAHRRFHCENPDCLAAAGSTDAARTRPTRRAPRRSRPLRRLLGALTRRATRG